MKKLIIYISISLIALNVSAGDGDTRLNYNGGLMFNSFNTSSLLMNNTLGVEYEGLNRVCWEFYLTHMLPYEDTPDGLKPNYDHKSIGVGIAYKPVIFRNMFMGHKNSLMRLRLAFDMGGEGGNGFYSALGVGFEMNKCFKNGMQITITQKNDFLFWSRDSFRAGLLIGFKIPLN